MNYKIVRISALCALMTTCAFAQKKDTLSSVMQLKEVVVSDSKFALSKEKSGKVIVKITADDLAKRAGQSLATVLSSVAGLEMNGNQSAAGKNISYYVRGARNRQTLILVDGMPVTDASGINLDYDLRLIPVEQVESIEILKGAASTLYGSGAAAGVINITLKKAGKQAIAGNAYMSLGTQTTADMVKYNPQDFNQGFNVNGSLKRFNYYASLNSTETKGISEAQGTNFEENRFSRVNTLVKLGYKITNKFTLGGFTSIDRLYNTFDSGAFVDNLENYGLTNQYKIGLTSNYKYNKGEFVINSSGTLFDRDYFSYGSLTKYKSRNANLDAFNKFELSNQLFLVAGGQFQFFDSNSESLYGGINNTVAKMNTLDPYINVVYNSDFGLNVNAGTRLNVHSNYGNHLVYNVNPSYNFKNFPLKVLASYSTAYITPSLFQLYDGYSGNLVLEAEDNSTVEAGFELKLVNNKLNINSVAFYREEHNAIEYYENPITYEASYFNANGKYQAKGIETTIGYAVSNQLKVNVNYTINQMEDKVVNNSFPDVKANLYNPKHKINAGIDYQCSERTFIGVNYQYLDQREGFTGYPPVVSKLDSYQIVNATAKQVVIKNRMIVFGSVSNIFNESFVETVGYNTRGRNFKIGLNILF
jgi:vitamin B12 transporter